MANPDFNFFDFTGGMHESGYPTDYSDRQAQVLKGFVLQTNGCLRSQWECQKVTTITGVASVKGFRSGLTDYLVAIKTDGTIWWIAAPSESSSNTTVAALTGWTQVSTSTPVEGGSAVSVPSSTTYRFMCEIPSTATASVASSNSLIINSASISVPAITLYENPSSAGTLLSKIYTGATHRYPSYYLGNESGVVTGNPALDIFQCATPLVMPHGTVGTMWGDFLCVAGGRWFKSYDDSYAYESAALSDSNSGPHPRGMWVSSVHQNGKPMIDGFLPTESFSTGFLSPEAIITDLRVIDQGLLVFTTSTGSGRSGVVLQRGFPYDFKTFPLKDSIGTADTAVSNSYQKVTGYWPEGGISAFVEKGGGIWWTDGDQVDRLDNVGPQAVNESTWGDCAEGLKGYLLVSRGNRLLCLNSVGREQVLGSSSSTGVAAWTELVTPDAAYPCTSLTTVGQSTYFVNNGSLYRYNMKGAERGSVNGTPVTLTVVSAPVGDVTGVTTLRFSYAGVEVLDPLDSTAAATPKIVTVGSITGSLFTEKAPLEKSTTIDRTIDGPTQAQPKAHGPSRIGAVKATFTGDIVVNSLHLWITGKIPNKKAYGQ